MNYSKHFITYNICIAEDLTLKEKVEALENLDFLEEASKKSKDSKKSSNIGIGTAVGVGAGAGAMMGMKRIRDKKRKAAVAANVKRWMEKGKAARSKSIGKKLSTFIKKKAVLAKKAAPKVAKLVAKSV